jgi:transposase
VIKQLPNAAIAFDKFHVIEHASKAVSDTRHTEQKIDPSLKVCAESRLSVVTILSQKTRQTWMSCSRMLRPNVRPAWVYQDDLFLISYNLCEK